MKSVVGFCRGFWGDFLSHNVEMRFAPVILPKEYLTHFGRELCTCSPGGCHYFPEYKDFNQLWGWFCPFLQTFFFLLQMQLPFLLGITLLLLELHRCIFFFHPKILCRWKKQNLTLSLGIFGCLAAPSTSQPEIPNRWPVHMQKLLSIHPACQKHLGSLIIAVGMWCER